MKHITLDVETFMPPSTEHAEVLAVPRLVCMSYTDGEGPTKLVARARACELFAAWIRHPGVTLSGHNVPFDLLACLRACWEETGVDHTPAVFDAIRDGRVSDTAVRASLLAIAGGGIPASGLGLATCVADAFGHDIGEDKKIKWSWRYRYSELDGVPVEDYPEAARRYACDDTTWTRKLWVKQGEVAVEAGLAADEPAGFITNERFQVAAALWCAMVGARGLRVDHEWAERMEEEYLYREEEAARWLRSPVTEDGEEVVPLIREDGTMDTTVKRALFEEAFASIGEEPKRTGGGLVSTDQENMDRLIEKGADGPRFRHLALYNQAQKFRSAYLAPILEAGSLGLPMHHRLNPMVDSGRTSARGPNVQNFPARAKAKEKHRPITGPMIRGCLVPREGYVLVASDYEAVEMAGLAQVTKNITGEVDEMGEAINRGDDLHITVAARLVGTDYATAYEVYHWGKAWEKAGKPACESEDPAERANHARRVKLYGEVAVARQFGKVVNYGGAGGCGATTLRVQGKQQGVEMSLEDAKRTMRVWHQTFPRLRTYFDMVERCEDRHTGMFVCEQHGPNGQTSGWRRRLTKSYTSACNTFFQGIVADGAKMAGWLLARACYADKASPLYGCAIVLFVHDEFVLEVPADRAEEAGRELSKLMVMGMQRFIPDIRISAEATIHRERWSK